MSNMMLINAARSEEVRAAIVRGGTLENLEIEIAQTNLIKGNVYKGVVGNVEASLNACFVEIGASRQGFLSMDDIAPDCYHEKPKGKGRPRIEEVMRRGRPITVQVTRDAMGTKGSALTTYASLAGRFLVLMPHDDARGISRKIEDEGKRKKLKELIAKLDVPEDVGFILRTAGMDQSKTSLNRDVKNLLKLWKRITQDAAKLKAPRLLHQEGDLVVRMIRDYYGPDIDEIVVDTEDAAERVRTYFRAVMPRTKYKLTLHKDRTPLFTEYDLEDQIETIYSRKVKLPSGGSIVIDPTEALTAIDVNSGKSTRGKSQEETALKTNLEAARVVANQLRLRDLGGLLVVDFIDMSARKHNREVEKALKDAAKKDKARIYIGKISENGLLEINRQRIKQALQLRTHRECPTCSGSGTIPSPDFFAMQILRRIDVKASSGNLAEVQVDLHPEIADAFQNHFRLELSQLEADFDIKVFISARPGLHRTEMNISYKAAQGGKRRGGGRSRGAGRGGEGRSGRGKGDKPASGARASKGKGDEAAKGDKPTRGKGDKPARGKGNKPARGKGDKPGKGDEPARDKDDRPASGGAASEGSAEGAANGHDGSPEAMGKLTKSQKRRLRRKRKKERERLEATRAAEAGDVDSDDGAAADAGEAGSEAAGPEAPEGEPTPEKPKRSRSSRGRSRGRGRRGRGKGRGGDDAPPDPEAAPAEDDTQDGGDLPVEPADTPIPDLEPVPPELVEDPPELELEPLESPPEPVELEPLTIEPDPDPVEIEPESIEPEPPEPMPDLPAPPPIQNLPPVPPVPPTPPKPQPPPVILPEPETVPEDPRDLFRELDESDEPTEP